MGNDLFKNSLEDKTLVNRIIKSSERYVMYDYCLINTGGKSTWDMQNVEVCLLSDKKKELGNELLSSHDYLGAARRMMAYYWAITSQKHETKH